MSHSSAHITELVKSKPEVHQAAELERIFNDCRYFIAPEIATGDFLETKIGYYKGRVVHAGKKANKHVTYPMRENISIDYAINQMGFVFVDFNVTGIADENMKRGILEIMTDAEADEYEREVMRQKGYDDEGIENILFPGKKKAAPFKKKNGEGLTE
jgi:hypothetical protein